MENEWQETLLEELADEVTVGFVGSMTSEYVEDGIPFLRSKNVDPYRILWDDMKYVSRQFHQRIKKSSLGPGDVVIVRTGKPGTASIIPDTIEEANCSDLVIVRPGAKLDKRFLVYYINSAAKNHINAHLVGAVQQHFNVGAAKKLSISLPPLAEQKAIAHVLGSLDDKIELNRRMNETLEGMAQALFKSWFVDFDPVLDNALVAGHPIPDELAARAETRRQALANGSANRQAAQPFPAAFQFTEELGWIPEGWKVKKAESIVVRKKVNQKFTKKNVLTSGDIPVFDQGAGLLLGFHDGLADIDSSQMNPSFIFGDHTCITHLSITPFSVGPNVIPLGAKGYDPYWTYFAIKDIQAFQEYRRHWMEFKIKQVLVPFEHLALIFGNFIRDMYISMEANIAKSVSLTKLRDTLLPKLISGELRIPNAEKLAQEALA